MKKNYKKKIFNLFFRPSKTVFEKSKRRHVVLFSVLTLAFAAMVNSGVYYMGFLSPNPNVGVVLAGAELLFIIAYIFSRTRFYQTGIYFFLITLTLLPVFNIALSHDFSAESLLVLLIWNVVTVMLASVLGTFKEAFLFTYINLALFVIFLFFIPHVFLHSIAIPLLFNFVVSVTILLVTWHRNMLEQDRFEEISEINERLRFELVERERMKEQMNHSATHDLLTGLPNRVLLIDRIQHVIDSHKRGSDKHYALLLLGLDRFKFINDTLGHEVGDQLLVEAATRLNHCVRVQDTVGRLGGDEFVVLLEDVRNTVEVTYIVERIFNSFSEPCTFADRILQLSTSVGIAYAKDSYRNYEEILRDADLAMYRAKQRGVGRYELFDQKVLQAVRKRIDFENNMRQAIAAEEFVLFFQPVYDLSSQKISGFEALVRWERPRQGLLLPTEFIPFAEESGLIIELGQWILEKACSIIRSWNVSFRQDPPLTVSVNISPRQFEEPDFVDKVFEVIEKNGISPLSLKLELTESLLIKEKENALVVLERLQQMGVDVQIDDFGTGYSSLGYLNKLPVNTLKIDKVFIDNLGSDSSSKEIVQTIMALARGLDIRVVAEGVEKEVQLKELESMGCEYVQGFLFSKPVSAVDAEKLLNELK